MKFDSLATQTAVQRNYEGGEAFTMSREMELYTAVVTCALAPATYEGTDERVERIAQLVQDTDPAFVARLAVYARTQMNLRSIPLLLAVELARVHNGDSLVARTVEAIVQRADEIMELLACYQWRNPTGESRKKIARLSRQIQNGLQRAFNHFDEYQFAKYNSDSRGVKLRDALFLVHPKAKAPAQQQLFDRIANGTLATPYTWETELSALGQQHFETPLAKQQAFSAKWQELIASRQLGYMALLRNLRNILKCPALPSATANTVIDTLADKRRVLKSRQLPFRYLAAYREVAQTNNLWTQGILDALEEAVLVSAENIAGFSQDTSVLIAADVSGSMYSLLSPRSAIRNYDIGLLLAMMLKNRCQKVISGIFGDTWMPISLPAGNILANVGAMQAYANKVGYSTNGHLVIDYLCQHNIHIDKIMLFTDCQMWDSRAKGNSLRASWHRYKAIAPSARLYLFDLAGYGQAPLSLAEKDVFLIAGWSDKVFDILAAIENGSAALDEINRIEL